MATRAKLASVANEIETLDAERESIDVAMAAAFAEIEAVAKDKVNPHFNSKYADLGSVIEALRPILAKHFLYFVQRCQPSEDGVVVETLVRHVSGGEFDLGRLYVPANKRDAQGFGSALTYARRYALVTAFGVPTEDDDGNAAVASARPTTGETPPRKRVTFDGPYSCPSQLKAAARAFADTLSKIGDMGELIAWEGTKDYREFVEQCQRDMPEWWETGEGMPAEFIPLAIRVANKRRELEELEGVR